MQNEEQKVLYLYVVMCSPNYNRQAITRQDIINKLKIHFVSQL